MRIFSQFMVLFILSWFAFAMASETYLMHYPDIYENTVVFNYDGDLWKADITTGQAIRLTSHPGEETYPHFSPDGKWIAFTAEYDGNRDVYVMPSEGGEPVRLTYHGGNDMALGWTPDGSKVIFSSGREAGYVGPFVYLVSVKGGFPEKLPVYRAAWVSLSPDGKQVAFNRRRGEFRNWKRYRGGEAQDVWIGDLQKKTFRNITADYPGIDQRPLWIGQEIYFISDRQTNVANLWAYNVNTGEFTRKTHFTDFAVYAPETDGKSIVFEHAGRLYLYRIATGKLEPIHIELQSDDWKIRSRVVKPAKYLGGFSVSPDGKWAVVEARGDLFKINQKTGKWENLTRTQGVRERYPTISPDGKQVAYFSDKTGEYQLYVQPVSGKEPARQLTHKLKTYPYHPVWSPDGQKLLFGDKDYRLRIVYLSSGKMEEIDRGTYQKDYEFFWEISEYDWSPDSKWVVYSKVQPNLNSAIYLYSLEKKKVYPITDGHFDDFYPVFDKKGKYLYFISQRHFQPALDPSEDNYIISQMSQVMVVQLRDGEKPPFCEDAEEDESNAGADTTFRIDLTGIQQRIYRVPVDAGNFKKLVGGLNTVFVLGKERFGFPGIEEFFNPGSVQDYFVKAYAISDKKQVKMLDAVGDFTVSSNGKHLIYRSGDKIGIVGAEAPSRHSVGDGKLALNKLEMNLDPRAEWKQIFHEVWRWYRDFFYDPNMHGVNWQKVYDAYEPLLAGVRNRGELNGLLREMVGEICASHMYIFGGDRDERNGKNQYVGTGLLGADLLPDTDAGLYRIVKIYRGASYNTHLRSPLASPDIRVREGDYLFAIDGHRITIRENYLKYLVNKANKEVEITVVSHPEAKDKRTFRVKTVASERALRRYEWVRSRAELVEKWSNGRIGYIHMDDMDEQGLAQFEEGWKANKYKPGLILDVRYNGGGFTNYFVIDKLERKLVFGVKTRDFHPMRFPMVVSNAKMAAIINEFTGSDGELFTKHFQARHFGKVFGTRTWGGLIGIINALQTVDGGIAVQPNVGFYNWDGQWIVENHGADPDVWVDIPPEAGLKGEDPQLKEAVDDLLREIEKQKPVLPPPPPFPKSKP